MKFKSFLAVCLAALLVLPLGACQKKSDSACIYFALPDIPKTVDPQTASSPAELILVRNLYEGLLRKNGDGKLVNGVADRYSQDGNTYTFHINKNACWDTGEPITADDFVFAFQRAVLPATECPTAAHFQSIDGAAQILAGKADVSRLGVRAVDNQTFAVTLCKTDEGFLELLTTAPCMPCNREFFEKCVGKYGLSPQTSLCNGSYYLARWNTTDFGIRIKKNAEYHGNFAAKNGEVFFSGYGDIALKHLKNGDIDLALLYGDQAQDAQGSGFKTVSVENICWVLTVSGDYSKSIRQALAQAVCTSEVPLPAGFRNADTLFPAVVQTDKIKIPRKTPYDIQNAKKKISAALQQMEDGFPITVLYYSGDSNPAITAVIQTVVGHWQQHLSTFINIQAAKDPSVLAQQAADQTLQMAVFPLTATGSIAAPYLSVFGNTPEQTAAKAIDDCHLIPLVYETTYLAYTKGLSGVSLEPGNGNIDFSQIVKTK